MKTKTVNYLFLLGGHDLEMVEIKNLLVQNKQDYLDKNLSWGAAKWSDYSTEFKKPANKGKIFVGIELSDKQDMPENGIDIDHHNFNSDKASSIEQISRLLNVELNHWQQLVAANDRGYIHGLEQMCATKEEIKKIREADKQAQGVTAEDEAKALESVKNHKEETDGFVIIKSLTDKFSPITDLMFGNAEKLIVYNDTSLSYYGQIPKSLISHYKKQIKANKAYYGGNSSAGFFGLSKGHWTKNEIDKEKQKIIEIMNQVPDEKIFSYHIFLFPFRWKNRNQQKDTVEENFNISTFKDNLLNNSNDWGNSRFELTHYDYYNEYNYFYEYVREILYDLGENLRTKKTEKNNTLLNHFEYKLPNEGATFYNIKLKSGKTYNLEIDSILLNIYKTGTGVLSFHLRNHSYYDPTDILNINKFGRRLYVPYFYLEPDSIYTGEKDKTNKELLLSSPKSYEIPDAIWIGQKAMPDKKDKLFENFDKYLNEETFKHGPFLLPKFIAGLFSPNFFLTHEQRDKNQDSKPERKEQCKVYLRPVLDDRMFVVSWYGNSQLAEEMNKVSECTDLTIDGNNIQDNRNEKTYYSYETHGWWYSYIYIDTSPMHTNKFQRQDLLKNQTYSRWVELGTLYGMSRYSLVMLTGDFTDLGEFDVTYLVRHLQSMYYKMAELCLIQRATILSFSNEITAVSDLINKDNKKDKDQNLSERIKSLYEHYLLFVNKIYFREITAQEQGIEMYDMMQSAMRIPQEVKSLDYEIDELNRLSKMLHDIDEQEEMKSLTKEAGKLTKVATAFLTPTLLIALLAIKPMPELSDFPNCKWFPHSVWSFYLAAVIVVALLSVIIYQIIIRRILKLDKQNIKTNKKY